jgi:GNAT superfamily N-acetyltransferase
VEIIEFKAGDTDLIDRAFAIATAAHEADTPENPAIAERFFRTLFSHPFPGRERHWFAAVENGTAVGYTRMNFFTNENLDQCWFEIRVHPDHRGTEAEALLREQVERFCAEHGRTSIVTGVPIYWEGGPARRPRRADLRSERLQARAHHGQPSQPHRPARRRRGAAPVRGGAGEGRRRLRGPPVDRPGPR